MPFNESDNTISHLHGGAEYHNKGMRFESCIGAQDKRIQSSPTSIILLLRDKREPRACPTWGKGCSYCNKLNHAAGACKKAKKERRGIETRSTKETANTMTPSETSTSEEKEIAKDHFAYMFSRRADTANDRVWHIILDIHGW